MLAGQLVVKLVYAENCQRPYTFVLSQIYNSVWFINIRKAKTNNPTFNPVSCNVRNHIFLPFAVNISTEFNMHYEDQ